MKNFTLALAAFVCLSQSQTAIAEINPATGQELYAKNFIGKKPPLSVQKLTVQKWLTNQPDTRGKYVLIDFAATWCGPCNFFMPHLNEIQSKLANDLVVVEIGDEKPELIEANMNKQLKGEKPLFAAGVDEAGRMGSDMGVTGVPNVMIINPEGIVIHQGAPAGIKPDRTAYVLVLTAENVAAIIQADKEKSAKH